MASRISIFGWHGQGSKAHDLEIGHDASETNDACIVSDSIGGLAAKNLARPLASPSTRCGKSTQH